MNINIHKNIFSKCFQHFKIIVYVKLIMSLHLLIPESQNNYIVLKLYKQVWLVGNNGYNPR